MTKFHDKDPASTKRSLLQWSSVHKFSWYHNHKGFNGLFYCLLRTYVYHQSRNSQFSRYLNFNSEINTSDFCFRIQSLCLQSLYTKKWQNIIYFLNKFFFQIDNIFIFPLPNLVTKEWIRVMMFNVAFNTVSLILWRSGVPKENHRPAASHWQTLSHNIVSSTPRLSEIRTHNISGWYAMIA
jgi:hypothetical protein